MYAGTRSWLLNVHMEGCAPGTPRVACVSRTNIRPIKHSTISYYVNEGRGRCAWQRHPTNEHNITIKQAMGFDTRKHPPLTRCARTHGKN